jgi:hypothetical protein
MLSLNVPVGGAGVERIELLRDITNQDITEKLAEDALYNSMQARAVELDKDGTGLPGVTYVAIFDALLSGDLDLYLASFQYNKKVLDGYVDILRGELGVVYESMVG